jgi:isopentenyl diphosphate isomerase/L-lactate dehydrogenase-like FMN-dependent dehydrogenase
MLEQLDPSVGWAEVEWVRSLWDGPMILKGILHPDEARQARRLGIEAVVVSNHGGRQLDGAISGIEALPPIVDAVGGDMTVIVDGGFRRGGDVVKALALGAKAVIIGRPQLWGVACAGEEGVHWVLELFAKEIDRALALGSWDGIDKLSPSCLLMPGATRG